MTARELTADQLYRPCNPITLDDPTNGHPGAEPFIAHERAMDAVRFGSGMRHDGYNIFALGPSGTGKFSMIRRYLLERALHEPAPDDWCYVNDFSEPTRPRTLRLPAGTGPILRDDVRRAIDELRAAIPSAFDSDRYRAARAGILEEIKGRQAAQLAEIERHAAEHDIGMLHSPGGIAFTALVDGEELSQERFETLPKEEQARITGALETVHREMHEMMMQIPAWEREGREKIRALDATTTVGAVGTLLDELRARYATHPGVVAYLDDVQADVIENAAEFRAPRETPLAPLIEAAQGRSAADAFFRRYSVNALVTSSAEGGAPVVVEDLPTLQNIVGGIEHLSHMGSLVTDFSLIRSGALHRANGGYLLLDAQKVLTQPFSWEALKRALRARAIRPESGSEMLGIVSTTSLHPEPIELDVKVVLVGEAEIYYLLCRLDREFGELFKVAADFDDQVERTPEAELRFAWYISSEAGREQLLPFDAGATARAIEQLVRASGSADHLSTHLVTLGNLLRESDYRAREATHDRVRREDVERAIAEERRRASRLQERVIEEIGRGTLLIETSGTAVGQVNGLSVIELNGHAFARPSRITASVRLGQGELIDIEREVELGGPIHSKGVMILGGYLGSHYAASVPLSLAARIVFEQSYGGVDGDSASSAELYALLSAIANVPLKQSLAVTGSVNQRGEVQAIGAVNDKIEGFFDLCVARGLCGQGVVIPAANVRHLMLRADVVDAVRAGSFHIHAVRTIDEGLEILTGQPAGERGLDGEYLVGTFNHRVDERLTSMAMTRLEFASLANGQGAISDDDAIAAISGTGAR